MAGFFVRSRKEKIELKFHFVFQASLAQGIKRLPTHSDLPVDDDLGFCLLFFRHTLSDLCAQRFAVRRARTMVINRTALPARPHQLELGVISRDQSHAADIQPIFRGDKRALIFALRISRLPAPLPLPTSNG